ncbi:hypothetical protein HNV11_17435 [Spirosoma taeanense]|uniref:Uncharacterized protein n=1 Tax=Spirosoma taeanense TaxID=2735870 RepID=A0A6M5YAN0_9BACT|nr:hypothetical protein [Spirosoma taeanense]QJW91029.1 hypothetical protein HNV11_17435 [Spirosoma taeanense]
MRAASLLVCLGLLVLSECQPREQPEPVQYNVPAEVEPYILSFRNEAAKRSYPVSTANLIVSFGALPHTDECGQCQLQSGKTPRITLSTAASCWQQLSANERECLVFHELGHCLLSRIHKTDRFPDGTYVSLMNPDNTGVYATCRYPINENDCDKRPRRTYYVDELFNPATPKPAWAR